MLNSTLYDEVIDLLVEVDPIDREDPEIYPIFVKHHPCITIGTRPCQGHHRPLPCVTMNLSC